MRQTGDTTVSFADHPQLQWMPDSQVQARVEAAAAAWRADPAAGGTAVQAWSELLANMPARLVPELRVDGLFVVYG